MNKEELINFLYYLLDKIDVAYYDEVKIRIERIIKKIKKEIK